MKTLVLLSLGLCMAIFSNAEEVVIKYDNGQYKYKYDYNKGVFDGPFEAWFSNGQKKIEGQYAFNKKVKTWKYWNEKGELILERVYTHQTEFQNSEKEIEMNSDGFVEYYDVKETDIAWSNNTWRSIKPSGLNQLLFENNKLSQLILDNIKSGKISPYKPIRNYGEEMYSIEAIEKKLETLKQETIYFRIKEQSFYDKSRGVMETRIINISTVFDDKEGKPERLFSVYFPDLRAFIAKEFIDINEGPGYIKTLDDVFVYRFFNSQLFKVSNVDGKNLSKLYLEKELEIAIQLEEIKIIEIEYEFASMK